MPVPLYSKYRPQKFSDFSGQNHIIAALKNAISNNHISHSYLLSGTRGSGKTSSARVLAKSLNCLNRQQNQYEPCNSCRNCVDIQNGSSLDVIEIDGASNNGVDSIRTLKENIALSPFNSRYKIYIIDEVHMLSQGAFNALLKTLEEPPEHVIFIMATTEPHKVPVTIRSRCLHLPFHSISPNDIYSRLEYVCKSEKVSAEPEALWEISRLSEGALRDALSILEQVIASGNVTLKRVEEICGTTSRPAIERWVRNMRLHPEDAYVSFEKMFEASASTVQVLEGVLLVMRDIFLASKWKNIVDSLGLSEQGKEFLRSEAENWDTQNAHYIMRMIYHMLKEARQGIGYEFLMVDFLEIIETPTLGFTSKVNVVPPSLRDPHDGDEKAPLPADEVLRKKLLPIAHRRSFWIYCALFDVEPWEKDNNLILDVKHKYTFMALRVDRTGALLSDIFGNYEKVILFFRGEEYPCPKRRPQVQAKPQVPVPVKRPVQSTPSTFGSFVRGLSSMGLNPEVILHKQIEPEEEENIVEEADE